MNERTKTRVRERAGHRCEYCQLHQDDSPLAALHIEHIVPKAHGGSDDLIIWPLRALIAICTKAPILPEWTQKPHKITTLFHPRRDKWKDNFQWRGIYVTGKTATGRTTIRVLRMNSDEQLSLRSS